MPALNDKLVSVLGKLVKVVKNGIQSMGKINPKDTINTFLIVLLGLILFFYSTGSRTSKRLKSSTKQLNECLYKASRQTR